MCQMVNICCLTLVFVLNIVAGSCLDPSQSSHCYSHQYSNPLRFYGTKTTYTVAKATLDSSQPIDHNWYSIPKCKPIMFYFIGRHAIRYPDGDDITEMSRVLGKLQQQIVNASALGLTQLCEQDLQSIHNWKLNMNETDDNRISDTGIVETRAIAKDFKLRYPTLLDPTKTMIDIGVTTKVRTLQTADAFLQEITSDSKPIVQTSEEDYSESASGETAEILSEITKSEKDLLYFHDTCEDLLLEQGVRLEKPKRVKDLRKSTSMQAIIKRVNERLGFGAGNEIDAKVLRHIVRACYFEFAIFGQNSGWCSLLGNDEIKILEYLDDIEDYYEDAYGRNINSKQTCPLIGDLFAKVKQSVKSSKDTKTYLQFTHAGVMKRLYSGLGLFDVLHDNIDFKSDESVCLNDGRNWKSSLICPFNANFAAVLYKCKDNKKNDDKTHGKYKLLTLVQEKPVVIKGCDSYLCSVDKFIESYQQMSSNCDLKEICKI